MSSDPTEPDDADDVGESAGTGTEAPTGGEAGAPGTTDPAGGTDSTVVGSETGLDRNVAGALSYLLGPLTGILFYVLEDQDEFVRFHAAQSTIVFGGLFVVIIAVSVLSGVLAIIPVVGWLIALVLWLVMLVLAPAGFVLWAFLMYKAYSGDEYELPWVGQYARQYAPVGADPAAGGAGGAI